MAYIDEALVHYLYGYGETFGTPLSGPPFFRQAQNRSISAVLFTNQFTVPRFFRLAPSLPCEGVSGAIRRGICYQDIGGSDFRISEYEYRIGDSRAPTETWHQGVTLFLNPEATIPLSIGSLPCTSFFAMDDSVLRREVVVFHPVTSAMVVFADGQMT